VKRFGPYILLLILPLAVSGCGWTIGGAPLQASPANASSLACSGTVYTFVWGAVPNAASYVVEVYEVAAPGRLMASVSGTTQTASVTAALLACGGIVYRWRVGAVFTTNPTPAFSGFWTFTVQ